MPQQCPQPLDLYTLPDGLLCNPSRDAVACHQDFKPANTERHQAGCSVPQGIMQQLYCPKEVAINTVVAALHIETAERGD